MPEEARLVDKGQMRGVGRQIVLPWSKAIEIAAKSMKVRFGRSVVTTASIILAIAFLMSILTSTTIIAALKTRPRRHVVALRERVERARKGEDIGLTLPPPLDPAVMRKRESALEEAIKTAKDPLERRLAQAELAAAQAAREATQEHDPAKLAEARAKWPALRARADLVRAENHWTLLVRKLHAEGYTDVELEVRQAPPQTSFIQMMAHQMDPRDKWLAALASLVCFVGIWNAMLMSVHERFREIGTMKCLGALESFIVKLYFLESSFVGLVGTLIGIIIGLLLATGRAVFTYGAGSIFGNFDLGGAGLSALGTIIIGALLSVGAAIFPARSAAKMDPIVAMRIDE